MFEIVVVDCVEKFGFQEEIMEIGVVNIDVVVFFFDVIGGRELVFFVVGGGGGFVGVDFFIGVIDEIFFGRYVGGCVLEC